MTTLAQKYATDTSSLEYRDGVKAGRDGYPCNTCPYDNGSPDQSRREWLEGWYLGRSERDLARGA